LKPFDHAGEFQGRAEKEKLSRLTVRNAGITIFAQGCVFAIQLVGTVILARMLTPGDFGLVTMVTTFSLLLASFGLNGFTEAILQTEEINHSLASNLFWINLAGAVILATLFAAGAEGLTRFYSDPRITDVAIGLSLTIFFSIASVLHLSLLKRAMRFAAVSANDIVGRTAYVLTAICCASLKWGYWALVAGAIAQAFVVCVGAWTLCSWLPGLPRRVNGTGKTLRYAMSVYARCAVNYSRGNADNLLVGWRFGASSLGFYKKAYDLFVLPSGQLLAPIVAVVVTTLSRLNKDRDSYKRHFLKGLSIIAFVGMAAGAELTLMGRDLVRVLLGPNWSESGRIFTYFAPGVGLMLVYQTQSWIHLSIGTVGRWLRWTVIELSVTGTLFLLALRWGPAAIAAAWTSSFCILMIPAFWYAGQPIELPLAAVIGAVWRYLVASIVAGLACAGIVYSITRRPLVASSGVVGAIGSIAAKSALFTLLYLAAVVVLHASLEPLREFVRIVSDLLPGDSSSARFRPVAKLEGIANSSVVALVGQEAIVDNEY
jgi:O-antigen/teichoic acid export membrane protein